MKNATEQIFRDLKSQFEVTQSIIKSIDSQLEMIKLRLDHLIKYPAKGEEYD